jgi:hypothetical protein
MPSIPQVTRTGPRTYVPATGTPVTAGQVVEAHPTVPGRIRPAAAGSTRVLGVALQDAIAPEDLSTAATTVNGRPVLNTAVLPQNVAVAYAGTEVTCTFAAAANFGDALAAAANGQVTPVTVATADPRTIVGRCVSPNNVAGAGSVGLVRLGI